MTYEEAELKRKEKFAVLMQVFPGDLRLCNGIASAEGVADQLVALADALRKDVRQFYVDAKPGVDTTPGEERLMQTVADVLAWATSLELSLHDLRKALFFRFNIRVKRPDEPVRFEEAPMQGIPASTAPALPEPTIPRKAPEALSEVKQEQVMEKLQGLFDEVKT
jgi:hypothetical protein